MKISAIASVLAASALLAAPALADDDDPSEPSAAADTAPTTPASASAPVAAAPPEADAVLEDARAGLGTKRDFWKLAIGPRFSFISDSGLDPFAKNDNVNALSIYGSRTLFAMNRAAVAAGLGFDAGGRSANARGLKAELGLQRMLAHVEGRYHLFSWAYGFARLAPGAQHISATLADGSSATGKLSTDGWAFTTDLSVGASFLVAPHRKPARHLPRIWVTPEVGYTLTTSQRLLLEQHDRDDPRPTERTDLGNLAMNGAFVRATVDISF